MASSASHSSDRIPDTAQTIQRWNSIAIVGLVVLIFGNHPLTRILITGALYGLFFSSVVWLLTHTFKDLLIRYTRAFESHSPKLVWTLVTIFVASGLLLLSMTGFIIFHPGFHWYDLPLHLRIPSWIAIALFFISSFELAFCEHMHVKREAQIRR
ncbi:hypothetical protein LLG95_15000 [bacterium]|nr:hypothetical protein [bacterium]